MVNHRLKNVFPKLLFAIERLFRLSRRSSAREFEDWLLGGRATDGFHSDSQSDSIPPGCRTEKTNIAGTTLSSRLVPSCLFLIPRPPLLRPVPAAEDIYRRAEDRYLSC